jgi:hypothetical protein
MKTGTILLENQNGVGCQVNYIYNPANKAFKLRPSGRFTAADVDRVQRDMPNYVKAIISFDIQDKKARVPVKKRIPNYALSAEGPICGVSGGR